VPVQRRGRSCLWLAAARVLVGLGDGGDPESGLNQSTTVLAWAHPYDSGVF
jgi:hypothetical protein